MFERYTERARRVLFFARYEASQLGSISIETEHLLLGLIREGKGLTSRIFARSHLSLENIRKEIEGRTVFREKVSTSVEIPFSAETKRVLQYAAEECDFDRGRHLLAKHGPAFEFLANTFEGEVRAGEDPAGQTLALANQPEEEVLGLYGDAAELTRLVPREEKNPPRSFRIAFEHPGLPMVYRALPDIHYTTAPARSVTAK